MNHKIRSAGFVAYKSQKVESFKNARIYSIFERIQPRLQDFKRFINSIIKKPVLWSSFVDWNQVIGKSSIWFVEAVIEGLILNWSTHKIFGLEFGIGMIIAHGFLIKQSLNLYRRLKQDGATTTIPKKNN